MATEGAAAATAPSPTEGIRLLISSVNVDASEAALAKAEAADAAEAARRRRGKLAADDDEEEEDDEDLDAQDEEEDDDAGAAQRTAHFTRRVAGTFHRGSDRFKFHDDDTPTAAAAAASARSAAEKFTPKDIAEKLLSAKEREAARQLKIRQAEEQDEEEAVDELGEIRHRDAPRSMRKLMQAPELPTISVAPDRQVMLLRYAHSHLALSAVSAPELHLAGMLIDTRAFGPSKPSLAHLATVIEISEDVGQRVDFNTASSATPAPQEATPGGTKPRSSSVDGIELPVQGLPKNYRVAHGRWSPDSMFCALVLIVPSAVQLLAAGGTAASTTEASNSAKSQPDDGDEPSTPQRVDTYELWVVERSTLQASLVSPLALHCVIDARHAVMWGGDSRTLVYRSVPFPLVPPPRKPTAQGPIIQESTVAGARAPMRTLPNLIRSNYDSNRFKYYTTAQVAVTVLTPTGTLLDEAAVAKLPSAAQAAAEVALARAESFAEVRKVAASVPQWHVSVGDKYTATTTLLPLVAAFRSLQLSPDGRHLLVDRFVEPYSCRTAYGRFAHKIVLYDLRYALASRLLRFIANRQGKSADSTSAQIAATARRPTVVKRRLFAELPAAEHVPISYDAVPVGPRLVKWRPSVARTIFWCEALDGGDPKAKVLNPLSSSPDGDVVRDGLFMLSFPFTQPPQRICTLPGRMAGVDPKGRRVPKEGARWSEPWDGEEPAPGVPKEFVIVRSMWRTTRNLTVTLVDLSSLCVGEAVDAASPRQPPTAALPVSVLSSTSYEDRYSSFGRAVLTPSQTRPGGWVVHTSHGGSRFFINCNGAGPAGDRPNLASYEITTGERRILWQSRAPWYERVLRILEHDDDRRGGTGEGSIFYSLLLSRESQREPPNFFIEDIEVVVTAPGHFSTSDDDDDEDDDEDDEDADDSATITSTLSTPSRASQTRSKPRVHRKLRKLTHVSHPYPKLRAVRRLVIHYKRADGVALSADLYVPPAFARSAQGRKLLREVKAMRHRKHKKSADGVAPLIDLPSPDGNVKQHPADAANLPSDTVRPEHGDDAEEPVQLPCLLWAYPTEFLSSAHAGQVKGSFHRFVSLSKPSLFMLCEGYAVVDNPSIPIIGVDGQQPNDTYLEQLVAGVRAAAHEVARLGVADPQRMAIAGHSYGSFMAANVLAHAPGLFQCGVLRSGAYNRTLTPFGFQREERTLWDNPELYVRMSPYIHAHQITAPVLLVHGDRDPNPGTQPIQAEFMYLALKGLGKVVRYVVLPGEKHRYEGRRNVGHALWEMANWLNTHLRSHTE